MTAGTAAPRLSIVVPAHDVEPYIEQCIRSVTASAGDVEVLVVDDGSTDGTRARVERERERDDRVRLIALDAPRGPGEARNAALAQAAGEFVWFVDGDDWLLEGAVDRVLARLEDNMDVLLVGHVAVGEDGREHPGHSSDLLAMAPARRFVIEDWPQGVTMAPQSWHRVFRRAFLEDANLRFADAPVYEDVVIGVRSLLEARAIQVEPAPCYAYRLSRPGALTISQGAQHLCWAAQWDAALLGARVGSRAVQDALFRHMVVNGWYVLWHDRRLRDVDRPPFFRALVDLHERHRRAGGPHDPILAAGSWPLARALNPITEIAGRVRRLTRRAARAASPRFSG